MTYKVKHHWSFKKTASIMCEPSLMIAYRYSVRKNKLPKKTNEICKCVSVHVIDAAQAAAAVQSCECTSVNIEKTKQ